MTSDNKKLERKVKREFWKRRKSEKYKELKSLQKIKISKAKKSFYENFVEDLKETKPGKWYGKLKRMACYDQVQFEPLKITSLEDLSDKDAAERIADSFASVSQKYDPLDIKDLPAYLPAQKPPKIHPHEVI